MAYHVVCKLQIQRLAHCRLSQAGVAKPWLTAGCHKQGLQSLVWPILKLPVERFPILIVALLHVTSSCNTSAVLFLVLAPPLKHEGLLRAG